MSWTQEAHSHNNKSLWTSGPAGNFDGLSCHVLERMNLHLSPTCLPFVSQTCLPYLSPTLVSHTCLPHLFPTLGSLGRINFYLSPSCLPHLFPTLGPWGRMSLHLFPRLSAALVFHFRCLTSHNFTLISHLSLPLGCLGPHEFSLVFHVFPILVFHCGRLGSHDFRFVSHLSPILIFHTCLLVWVPWAA